jgi:hypothetical protein
MAQVTARGQRSQCIGELQTLLEDAMEYSSTVREHGRVKWMAYIIICDMEEFLIDPFGIVDESSIAEGNYSIHGLDMVNRTNERRITFQECINEVVSYIYQTTPVEHWLILGYRKADNEVENIVNGRPFSGVDAEHFLCKAWIVAKSTFGNSRLSKYPRLCNAHTHPSPVIHAIGEKVTENAMEAMETAFWSCSLSHDAGLVLPKLCLLPGEEKTFTNRSEQV